MISVMMPVYNAGEFLKEAIEGILNQTEKNFELIIVNDGSTDNSEEIILSYNDPRIVYLKKENGGESSARNLALLHAKGEFIVFQDADDVSLPNRLETLKNAFISDEVGFVHSDMTLIDEFGTPIGYWQSRQIQKDRVLRFFLKIGTPFNNPSMMVRKKLFEGLTYDITLKIGPDTDMVMNFATKTEGIHIPEPLLLYRRHSNNISKQSDYSILFAHVQKFLKNNELSSLVPELNWNDSESLYKAKAIISLFLLRRGMATDAATLLNEVIEAVKGGVSYDTDKFLLGIANFVTGKLNESYHFLLSVKEKDHVVENYIGEILATAGDINQAKLHFLHALKLSPNYCEAVENIKSIGTKDSYNFIDNSWLKYKK